MRAPTASSASTTVVRVRMCPRHARTDPSVLSAVVRRRSGAALCLLALVFAGDALSLERGQYGVAKNDLNALTGAPRAPALGPDDTRVEAPTTTLVMPVASSSTVPLGPGDPPPPPEPPPLPLRPARLDTDFADPT